MPDPTPTIAPTNHDHPDPRPRKLRPTDDDARWYAAREIHYTIMPVLDCVRALDWDNEHPMDHRRAEEIARLCQSVRTRLGELKAEDSVAEELEPEYRIAQAIMTGMGSAAFFVGGGHLQHSGSEYCDPHPYHPAEGDAYEDVLNLLTLAEERWPERGLFPD